MVCILTLDSMQHKVSVSKLTVTNLRIEKAILDCANSLAYKKDCYQ